MRRVLRRHFFNILSRTVERKLILHPARTGRVAGELYTVNTETVNFYIYRRGDTVICFDAGYRRWLIAEELRRLGIDPEKVTHVFLTHADIDHVLGLRLFRGAGIYLSRAEEELLRGFRSVRRAVRTPRLRRPYTLLRDGDVVKAGEAEVRAIETPGHTPGSMAYLLNGVYLFTGDTCKLADGRAYAGGHYTMDIKTQEESIRKLAQLRGVRCVLTAHSGYTNDFDRAFGDWR